MSDGDLRPPGWDLALERLRRLAAADPELDLDESQPLAQGRNNRVLAVRHRGRPAVFKFFDDRINKPGAARRRAVEARSLAHFAALPFVPEVYAKSDDAVVIARLPGRSLAALLREEPTDAADLLARIGTDLGAAHARLAGCRLAAADAADFADRFHRGRGPADRVADLLARAEPIAAACPELAPHRDTIAAVADLLPDLATEAPLICRYDNNFDNCLVVDGRLAGLIDFEQCFLGTETLLFGAVLDTIPEIYPRFPRRPRWATIAAAYAERRGRAIDRAWTSRIAVAAMANHWQRIVETHDHRGGIGAYADRFAHRFPVLKRIAVEGRVG